MIVSGIYLTRRQSSADDYFRAGRTIPAWAVSISFLATTLSAATFIGGPQQSYRGDLTYLSSNIGSILAIVIVAIFFIPLYYKLNVDTVYGLLRVRFGTPASLAASLAFLVGRLFASGARLYIAALPASFIVYGDISLEHQIISISVLTLIGIFYTYAGGIRTVIWTDVIQVLIFVSAALIGMAILIDKIPISVPEVITALQDSDVNGQSKLTVLKFGIFNFDPKSSYTLLTAIFGFSLLSLGAYGTDHDMAQRLLTCKNAVKGSKSAIWGVLLGLPVTAVFMFLGLWMFIYYSRPEIMGEFAPAYAVEGSRKIFLTFILNEMPAGLKGIMMAGLFAAALSSLNSAINSMSSSMVNDIYKLVRPRKSEREYLSVGRKGVLAFGLMLGLFAVISVYWQAARPETTLIDFALMVMVFAYSGLTAVYLLAIFTKRGNNISIISALIAGFVSVFFMQMFFAGKLAFPWQMFIGTSFSFVIGILGSQSDPKSLQFETSQ